MALQPVREGAKVAVMGESTRGAMAGERRSAGPNLYTIPHHRPFLPALAAGIMARHPDPLARARALILLPSSRAVRALAEAFLQAADGQAALLPRMAAIGQVDEDEALGRFAESDADAPILPPAIPALEQLLALAGILAPHVAAGPVSALAQADALGRVMDQLVMHGVTVAELGAVALDDMAGHWQRSQAMLATLASAWPGLLAERGLMADVERRERLLQALAERWAAAAPAMPVYAAGFASAPPAVARLLGVIARLPQGALLLPGLDPAMDPDLLDAVRGSGGVTHPHHGMVALLDAIGVAPAEVREWAYRADRDTDAVRSVQVAQAMLPAALADRWQQRSAGTEVPSGMALLSARGPDQEALAIALAMRRQLACPGATAALVTPSRPLARRVAGELARFGVTVDDSAGQSLRLRPHGILLLAMAAAAASRMAPVPLLALLKHPLVMAGNRGPWLAMVRALDRALRGLPPQPGIHGVTAHLERLANRKPDQVALKDWWAESAMPALLAINDLFAGTGPPVLGAVLAALRASGDALVGDALWQGQDGRAMSTLVAALELAPDAGRMAVPGDAAVRLLGALLDTVTVRPPWRQHPRLAIWGPLEARLQSADLVILGGMNEGVWPADPAVDPWLAPAMRSALGLPPAEARIGLMAHDLMDTLSAGTILCTRALRDDKGATIPSRFLMRIEAAIGAIPPDTQLQDAMALDGGDAPMRAPCPAPAPPPAARPRRLSVTDADMLAADPFSFYAKRILKLSELDPLEQSADAAMRGTAVHRMAECFAADPGQDPAPLVDAALADLGAGPALVMLWRPRLLRMLAWLKDELAMAAEQGWTVARVEPQARLMRGGVELVGKADRIDAHADGRYRIIDYKTGGPPPKKAFEEGHARQLPMLRMLLEAGGFRGIAKAEVTQLLYIRLSGGSTLGQCKGLGWSLDRDWFEAELDGLLARYLTGHVPFQAKRNPVHATRYRSFDHLARLEEWIGRG